MLRYLALLSILAILAVGCASRISGRDFSFDTMRMFSVGHSKKSDILNSMGEPWGRFQEKDSIESWLYRYSDTSAKAGFKMNLMQQGRSAIFLFKGDELVDFYWEESNHNVKGNTSGRYFTEDEIKTLKEQVTTIQEVSEHFGLPYTRRYRPDGSEMWVYVYLKDEISRTLVLEFQDNILKSKATGGS